MAGATISFVLLCARYFWRVVSRLRKTLKELIPIVESLPSIIALPAQVKTLKDEVIQLHLLVAAVQLDAQIQNVLTSMLLDAQRWGQYVCDANGNCIRVNHVWTQLTGMSTEDAKGRGWLRAVHRNDREQVWQLWQAAVVERRPFEAVYRFVHADSKMVTLVRSWTHDIVTATGERVYIVGLIKINKRQPASRQIEDPQDGPS